MASRSPSSDGLRAGRTEQLAAALALWCHRHPKTVLGAALALAGGMVARWVAGQAEAPLGLLAAAGLGLLYAGLQHRRLLAMAMMAPGLMGLGGSLALTKQLPLSLGLLVLAVGLEQGMHALSSLRAPEAPQLLASFRRIGRTVLPLGLSAAVGLVVLGSMSGVPSLLVAAAGIALASISHVTLVPALLAVSNTAWTPPPAPAAAWVKTLIRWAPTVGWATVLFVIALWPHTRGMPSAVGASLLHLAAAAGGTLLTLAVLRGLGTALTAGLAALGTVALTAGALMATGQSLVPTQGVGLLVLFCLALSAGGHLADRQDRSLLDATRDIASPVANASIAVALGVSIATLASPSASLRVVLLAGLVVNAFVTLAAVPAITAMVDSARDSEDKGGLFPRLAVTVGLAGDAPVGPGTLGALVAIPLGFELQRFGLVISIGVAVLLTALSIPITTRYLERTGTHDPSEVVLDELVGCLLAMVMAPFGLIWGWAAFGLFRLFDIAKPGPVRYVERRAGGAWGVIGDDVVAGIMAGAVLLGLRWAGNTLGWWA